MALVTLQRSPTPSAASTSSTATTNAGEDFGSDDERRLNQSLSESFFMVKGAALFLQQGSCPQAQRAHPHHKHANAMSLGNNDKPESESLDQETETQTTLPEAKAEGDFRQEETDLQGSSALPRNERDLKGLEKAEASCSPQQQEALIQLQRSGLVRRRKERLEKLSGLFQERARANEQREAGSSKTEDAMNSSSDPADPFHRSFGTRTDFGTEAAVPLTNEALLAVLGSGGLTPVSSPHGSTLTRSSSSDSLRSVRGKPGLVRQRTQEIEARMRLAGLTVPSRLKRSNSLAKLDSLTFSSEDLCSACSSDAGTLLMLSLSPEPEHSLSPEWAKPDNIEVFSQGGAGSEESKS